MPTTSSTGAPTAPRFTPALLHPRHWPAWLAFGLLRLIAAMPHGFQLWLGARFGDLLRRLAKRRIQVARRNLELCFPAMDRREREALLVENSRSIGTLIPEIAFAWWGSERRHRRIHEVHGLEHLQGAAERGEGVVLLFCHFTTLELAGRLLAYHHPMAALYREHKNPVLEYMVRGHRLDYGDALFNRTELRGMVRYLRKGGVLWYAPDQDYERGQSVFVPFFGIPTATITSAHELARMGRARILVTQNRRLPDGRYRIEIHDWLADLPTDDATHDCARINEAVERLVRECPEQYLWVHRRFKTRPPGEPSFY